MKTLLLRAPDISCDHCEQSIRRALDTVPGIRRVEVDIGLREVRVDFEEGRIGRGAIESILAREGYPVALDSDKSAPAPQGRGNACCGSCHI